MNRSDNIFAKLAARAQEGELSAQGELRRKLEPELVYIVRRVVQAGTSPSAVDRRILAEARRVGLDAEAAKGAAGEALIRQVARRVSFLLVDGLCPNQADLFTRRETVCT
jgi:hypothetical protein